MDKINNFQFALRFLVLFLILAGCNNTKEGKVSVVDIYGNMKNMMDIKLSDIADDVVYIPLETTPECLLSKGYNIVATEEYFFIADGEKPLFVFDREGKFVRKIGVIGNGPGEFINCYQFHLDEDKGDVYIFNKNKEFVRYTWDGEYLSTIEFPYRAMLYHKSNNGDFMIFNFSQTDRDSLSYKAFFTDRNFKLSGDISWKQKVTSRYGYSVGTQVWDWDNEIVAQIELCDTIYAINKDHLSPKVYLDFGSIRLKKEMLDVNDSKSFVKAVDNHILNYVLTPIDDIWGIKFSWDQKDYLGILNPYNQELVFASVADTSMNGFINDIDGGPGFFPTQKFEGDVWINAISAFDFYSMYQNGQFENSDVLDPEANKGLGAMASSLDEYDNPVLMIVKKKRGTTKW